MDAEETFQTCMTAILAHEGGLTNDAGDPGGITNWGISLRFLTQEDSEDHPTAETIKEMTQAEAEATALSEVLEVNLKDLVTKQDLKYEAELLRRDMHDMEQRLIIKLGALMAFSISIVAALVKLL